ncbi:plasmid-related protein [Comamonas endophytica]|uniref:plasmid-related protein n=1 Tax=Comamonas endophytica TaxID=2949090 RepID=UPI00361E15CE
MSIADVAEVLGRSADGVRVALYSDGDVSRRLRPTMVRVGRRVYFRTLQLKDALGLDGSDENRTAFPFEVVIASTIWEGSERLMTPTGVP